jgi:hypothetical protein
MLTQAVVLSSLAAAVVAVAAPEPAITAAPVRRQNFGDIGADIDDALSNIGGDVSDILGGIGTELGGIGSDLGGLGECLTKGLEILSEVPIPPSEVIEAIASITAVPSDSCFGNLLPESLQDEYSSYESEAVSWYIANSGKFDELLTACPGIPSEYSASLASATPCASAIEAAGGSTGGNNNNNNNNGGGSGNNNGGNDDDGSAGASLRVTGFVAVLAGAVVGGAAFLL